MALKFECALTTKSCSNHSTETSFGSAFTKSNIYYFKHFTTKLNLEIVVSFDSC